MRGSVEAFSFFIPADPEHRQRKFGVGRDALDGRVDVVKDVSAAHSRGETFWGTDLGMASLLWSEKTENAFGGFSFFPAVSHVAIRCTMIPFLSGRDG
jgi:hypothetical protein